MKKSLINYKTYLIAAILTIAACLISYLPGIIIDNFLPETNKFFNGDFLVLVFAVLFILIGYVVGNRVEFRYRRINKQYVEKLPEDIVDRKWIYRMPLFIAGFLTALVGTIVSLIVMS